PPPPPPPQTPIARAPSLRQLSWFCLDLVNSSSRREKHANLIELLSGHGVNRITLRPAYRPEVLQVAAPPGSAAGRAPARTGRKPRRSAARAARRAFRRGRHRRSPLPS